MNAKEEEKKFFREHKIKNYVVEIMTEINNRDRRRKLYDDIIGTRERGIKPCLFV